MDDLPDTEVIKTALASNFAEELLKAALVTVFRLDVEMTTPLPAVDVVEDMLRVSECLQNPDLLELDVSVTVALERASTLFDRIGPPGRRAAGRDVSGATEAERRALGVSDTIYGGKLAAAHFVDLGKVV